jgi:4'-phosphopantetheinyl transferase
MPLIMEQRINDTTILGIWHIVEESATLEMLLDPGQDERTALGELKNELRRQHWLSYRVLIRQLLGTKDVDIKYDVSGKPFILNPEGHISVTHSGPYSAVIYSTGSRVGIDIERIHDRIEKVSHKYLSYIEREKISDEKRVQHLVTLWAAKEAIYKLQGNTGVDFSEHIHIEAFTPCDNGSIKCTLKQDSSKTEFVLHYMNVGQYVLVWVVE